MARISESLAALERGEPAPTWPPFARTWFGKPLFGPLAGCHGARRGTYRIVYRIDEDNRVVHVLDIDHRSGAYRRPQR